jgi:hypothetical protein
MTISSLARLATPLKNTLRLSLSVDASLMRFPASGIPLVLSFDPPFGG